ncbi:MAG: FAD-dependent hydroxylase [Rhodocyclaceae bacterium]|nr:MAG: FAD-dependent hydroxylase [Rhodocyclaceae bacterium]
MNFDLLIVGAGPAGLSLALGLKDAGLKIGIIERQTRNEIAHPQFDGREIALTHHSMDLLKGLGLGDALAPEVSILAQARVEDGSSPYCLNFTPPAKSDEPLGFLIPNHAIRQALWDGVAACDNVTLLDGQGLSAIDTDAESAAVRTTGGATYTARLVVAADNRFSETRRLMGIGAAMHDFGRTMMVCRMEHEKPHHHVALEWFDYGQTVALLPCNGNVTSVVMTLPGHEHARNMALDETAFAREMERRLKHRCGPMKLVSERFGYPLVGVYAHRFVGQRFALAGDAAVGMHPVTAHGFNFGLLSQETLAREIVAAVKSGQDIGNPVGLARYERTHRLATLPLFLSTNAVATLFTDDSAPAKWARKLALRVSNHLPFFKQQVAGRLLAHRA